MPVEGSDHSPLLQGELAAPPPASASGLDPDVEREQSTVRRAPPRVSVTGPSEARRGDNVTFRIMVLNEKPQALEGLTVTCRLPDGLSYPDAPQRAFRQMIGRLEPDQQEVLDLQLRCDEIGRHCVMFEVTAAEVDDVTETTCVECTATSATLELIGPSERTIGQRAEFVLTLRNLTGQEQPDVHVALQHEGILEPREASAGAVRKAGRLEWDLGLLRVDERVQIEVDFECLSVADETCLTASVTSRSLEVVPVEACLRTVPHDAIDLDMVDQQDPVTIGERVSYVIQLTNAGLLPLSDVSIQLQTDGLQPVGVTLGEDQTPVGATFDRANGLISIPLAGALAPDATQVITLQTLATRSGQGQLQAVVMQPGVAALATITELTVINPLGGSVAWDAP